MESYLTQSEYFSKHYYKLSRFEQVVLQICSIIFDSTDTSTVLRCLYASKINTNINLHDYPRQIEVCFKKLKTYKFLTSSRVCNKKYVELISRQAVRENNFSIIAEAVKEELPQRKFPLTGADPANSLRDLRIDLYNNDIDKFHRQLVILLGEQRAITAFPIHPMVTICNNPFDPEWFSSLPVHIQFFAMHEIFKYSILNLAPLDEHIEYLQAEQTKAEHNLLQYPSFLYLLISVLMLQGKLDQANDLIEQNSADLDSLGLKGWLYFIRGKNTEAIKLFKSDLQHLIKLNNQNDAFFTGFEGIIYCLALIKSQQAENTAIARDIGKMMQGQQNNIFAAAYKEIRHLTDIENSDLHRESDQHSSSKTTNNSISTLFKSLAHCLIKGRLYPELETATINYSKLAYDNGYQWLAMEYAEILSRTSDQKLYNNLVLELRGFIKVPSIVNAIKHKNRWQLALEDLNNISTLLGKDSKAGTCRIAWLIQTDKTVSFIKITPKEQRLSKNGSWSKGRVISPKKLFHQEDIDYLTDHDKKICAAIKRKKSSSGGIHYYFDTKQALYHMAGHKNIFSTDSSHIHMEVSKGEPELRVSETEDAIKLEFFPPKHTDKIYVHRENFSSLKVISITDEHRNIAEVIGPHGLTIPQKARKQVLQTIGKTANYLSVFSDLGGIESGHSQIEADSRIHMQIMPTGQGFRVGMYVRPFNSKGPYFKPGVGAATIFSEIKGELLQTTRNLQFEEEIASTAEEQCDILALHEDGDREWILPSPNDCLEFLYSVRELDNILLEWPQGEKLRVQQSVGPENCHLKINRQTNWFEITGDLQIDKDQVMSITELLQAVRKSGTRFIQLKDGEFLALTKELYSCAESLDAASQEEEGKITLLPIALKSLENIAASGIKVEADNEWHNQIEKIRASDLVEHQVPSTLSAVLRDYQVKGFRWLMRLHSWGAGACLADDMGIGKTIQTLAVILSQAEKGPSLVVAPTSVCFNWQDEIRKFAPTLNTKSFQVDDRQKQLDDLGPFDVMITSYGLLQQVPELSQKDWQIIVLDEGQAIKNANTKRSSAAMKLKGQFRIITTGTPIENNLGELWNLFNFINPGLLGSLKKFNQRFASPIEKDKNRNQKKKLKNLISPFILRRLKTHVLEELPPRTEVNLFVDFNEDEAMFYEALRQQSLQKINENSDQNQTRFRILAEIMKLRRACCNPKLILPETDISSSKLALFEKTIDELQSNQHKTLVFSQFVSHLDIIRESLDRKKIKYFYLDGSTPAKIRKTRVDAFQAGHGDVFLISLKAGGVGLNLTAANYVIHMDPWWNPAVEDQASDRAHRIGQKQPVTIYKLITRNTIEEKIVKLHQQKRDLANSLLDGTDIGDKISADDLLLLLQEN